MRWDELFADLEAQYDELAAAAHADEVRDRTRREAALLGLGDRLRAAGPAELALTVLGAGQVLGRLLDVGPDWLLVQEGAGAELLVAQRALLGVVGTGARSAVPGAEGEVVRRLDLRWALRGLARGRAGVQLVLVDGSVLAGTLDRVGADHVDLAEHPPGEPRRAGQVRQVRLVPLTAIGLVRRQE